jgi:hypothetical protein
MTTDPTTNGTEESHSGSDTYASIKNGTYALKRDFNASTRYDTTEYLKGGIC